MKLGKNKARLQRAARTRYIIARSRRLRIVAHRSCQHTYVQLIDPDGLRVLVSSSTLEKDLRDKLPAAANTCAAARVVGERFATKVKDAAVEGTIAFDRNGFKYHGRIQALAEGIRAGGLAI